jgi:hypothetical protein
LNYSLISVHAPTEEKDDYVKENFYEVLYQIYEERPKRYVKTIIGDFNTKIFKEDTYRPTTGASIVYILYVINDN